MQPSDSSYSSLEIEQRAEFIFAKRAVFVSDGEPGEMDRGADNVYNRCTPYISTTVK